MFSWLKKHFIPHEGNEHRPHILRAHNMRKIVAVVIVLEIFSFLIPTLTRINMTGGMAAVLPAVLADLTNQERSSQNLKTLTVSPALNQVAEMKATDMATKGYFAHTSPEGKTPWYWLEKVGYQYQYAGENLAINFSDSKDVADAWMASPAHKANIVKGNYTEIGTGIANGVYEGRDTVFVAQVYANPLPKISQPIENKKPNTAKIAKAGIVEKESTNVLAAEVGPVQKSTTLQQLVASPRNSTNIILYIIFGLIVLALLLYIIIKMKNHHADLITNGLIVLAIVGAIFVANYYFSHRNMVITESLDYSNEHK
jgi:hypothetical protein